MSATINPSTPSAPSAPTLPPSDATAPPAPSSPALSLPADRSTWTEAHYTQALTHLTSLQNQIDSLRDAIPSLIRPLAAFQPSHQPQPHTTSNPALQSRLVQSHPRLSPTSNGLDRPTEIMSPAEKRRRKEKAVGLIKRKAEEGRKGVRELREAWEGQGTGVVLRAGREGRG
ncbi:hypothetical protein KVT40_005491 [Elsinoe batatas]|uniref:Uncharacterized protein n=1 Tax=Elsinoe batatas TaxID=2601811 RepID=A0A8K0KYL1_9PEZI|nr:hypothetical protein KVT40_005491 [Elsinoe batatas]